MTAPSPPLLGRLLRTEAERYLRALATARRRSTPEAVHALRTATRRLQALLLWVSAVHPAASQPRYHRPLVGPFRACGRVRDLQLTQAALGTRPRRSAELEHFADHIDQRLARQQRRLHTRLEAAHPRRLRRALLELSEALETPPARPADRTARARRLAAGLRQTRRDALRAFRQAQATDADSLHRARLAFKLHRYQAELAASVADDGADPAALRRFQSALGAITDATMLLGMLDRYARKHPRRGARLIGLRTTIERRRQRLIERHFPALMRRPPGASPRPAARAAQP